MQGYSALYLRIPRLMQLLSSARGDDEYLKLLAKLKRVKVLILDVPQGYFLRALWRFTAQSKWSQGSAWDSRRQNQLLLFDYHFTVTYKGVARTSSQSYHSRCYIRQDHSQCLQDKFGRRITKKAEKWRQKARKQEMMFPLVVQLHQSVSFVKKVET